MKPSYSSTKVIFLTLVLFSGIVKLSAQNFELKIAAGLAYRDIHLLAEKDSAAFVTDYDFWAMNDTPDDFLNIGVEAKNKRGFVLTGMLGVRNESVTYFVADLPKYSDPIFGPLTNPGSARGTSLSFELRLSKRIKGFSVGGLMFAQHTFWDLEVKNWDYDKQTNSDYTYLYNHAAHFVPNFRFYLGVEAGYRWRRWQLDISHFWDQSKTSFTKRYQGRDYPVIFNTKMMRVSLSYHIPLSGKKKEDGSD